MTKKKEKVGVDQFALKQDTTDEKAIYPGRVEEGTPHFEATYHIKSSVAVRFMSKSFEKLERTSGIFYDLFLDRKTIKEEECVTTYKALNEPARKILAEAEQAKQVERVVKDGVTGNAGPGSEYAAEHQPEEPASST